MNSFSLAYKNFRSNITSYGLHLAAMVFAVMVYYNFMSLKHNPDVIQAQMSSSDLTGTATAAAVVLLAFLVYFIWYSSSFFLGQRKKEIGIYTFLGIEKNKIAAVFTIENLFVGITSITIGIFLGVLTSKLFMMVLAKVALLDMTMEFFLSVRGLGETIATFLVIFGLTSLKGFIDIRRSELIDLFNSLKKEEVMPRVSYLKGVLSIVIIGAGYYLSISQKIEFMIAAVLTIILVIWGTYWLFSSLCGAIATFLTSRKGILYKGTNIVSISNLVFRIAMNYRTLAAVAVLVATTITAFATVSSLKYYVDQNYAIEVPYSYTYVSDDGQLHDQVHQLIAQSDHSLEEWAQAEFLLVDDFTVTGPFGHRSLVAVRFSDFARISDNVLIEDTKSGEGVYVEKPGVLMSTYRDREQDMSILGQTFTVNKWVRTPLFGSGIPYPALIISDADYETLQGGFTAHTFHGLTVSDDTDSESLTRGLFALLPSDAQFSSRFLAHKSSYDFVGIVYFLGSFMSLVFVVATGSIIYFKLLSDAVDDKPKYTILRKLGMTSEEIRGSISKQVGISFAIPLIVGAIHSIAAIKVLSNLLDYPLVLPMAFSILVFSVIYGLFFMATTKKFTEIV